MHSKGHAMPVMPGKTALLELLKQEGVRVMFGNPGITATAVGLPAMVAPIGHSEHGLAVGVQIIGGYFADRTTIPFAGTIEHAFGGFVPPPPSFAG
jgi:Asp-tRNA(Asn)/Glu-tRNA(Gln) amidotransferase A subunit family amidase